MSDLTIVEILFVVPTIVFIIASCIAEHNLKKKNASQRISLMDYGLRIKDLEYEVGALNEYIAIKEWRDSDVSSAYVRGGTSLSGIICPYCHMRTIGGDLTCSHCGAMVVDRDVVRLWGGK